jgi:hypothetical protein
VSFKLRSSVLFSFIGILGNDRVLYVKPIGNFRIKTIQSQNESQLKPLRKLTKSKGIIPKSFRLNLDPKQRTFHPVEFLPTNRLNHPIRKNPIQIRRVHKEPSPHPPQTHSKIKNYHLKLLIK